MRKCWTKIGWFQDRLWGSDWTIFMAITAVIGLSFIGQGLRWLDRIHHTGPGCLGELGEVRWFHGEVVLRWFKLGDACICSVCSGVLRFWTQPMLPEYFQNTKTEFFVKFQPAPHQRTKLACFGRLPWTNKSPFVQSSRVVTMKPSNPSHGSYNMWIRDSG